jgi:carbamoyltransferase
MWGNHDPGACLLRDDSIVAIAEEERFSRNKRGEHEFPTEAISYVLDEEGITLSEIDLVGIGRDPRLRLKWLRNHPRDVAPGVSMEKNARVLEQLMTVGGAYAGAHIRVVEDKLGDVDAEFRSIPHHLSHAASAAYCAPDDYITVTWDAEGEHDSTVLYDENLNRMKTFAKDNSLGWFYSHGTKHLGYSHGSDAGKVMGLASYGEYRQEFAEAFDKLTSSSPGTYDVTALTGWGTDAHEVLDKHFFKQKKTPTEFTQEHRDFAYHLQRRTEMIAKNIIHGHIQETRNSCVALAGGVGMNCKLNREILNADFVDKLFIQPAANDSGICLGAALEAYHQETGKRPDVEWSHVYYGPQYSSDQINDLLNGSKWEYECVDDICSVVAELLADGYLIGWFQGRMEFGARALGHRSILANPTDTLFRDQVNENVKHRESWRPFAPSLLVEARDDYLVHGEKAPFMILLDKVHEEKQSEIPAVTHVDGTTRPQTVTEDTAPRYYRLISEFANRTGVPVILNTSFNMAGEPIVESPMQALKDFAATGLDALAVGDYLVTKNSVNSVNLS